MVAASSLPQAPITWNTSEVAVMYTRIERLMNRSKPDDKTKLKAYQQEVLKPIEDAVDNWEQLRKENPDAEFEMI